VSEPRTRFPSRPGDLALTLSDEPVLIDGMKVLFDTKVTLYPVTLKPGSDTENGRRAGEERERRGRYGD
jgi:hypothetical protein